MSITTDELTTAGRLRVLADTCGAETAIRVLPQETRLTFRAWNERSDAAAEGLAGLGVEPGERVLVPADSDWIGFAIAYVAVHKAGAVAVPVLTSHGPEHVAWAREASESVGVIGDPSIPSGPGWSRSVAELEAAPKAPLNLQVKAHDDAQIIFTSGTTGRPKGVVATHQNLLHSLCSRPPGIARTVLHSVPLATNAGQGLLIQPLGSTPHTVMVLPAFSAEAFLEAIERCRPDDIVLVPAMALALLRAVGSVQRDLSSVRMVRTMSAPITPAALEQLDDVFPNAATVNMYASTESWPARVRTRFDRTRPTSVGKPEGSTRVRIVDGAGTVLPTETVGDVQLKADGAAPRRYLGDPESSARVFLADGWVRTGDVGHLDADGFLYLSDRKDDLVISGGLNISTLEVAAVLEEHPQVIEAAAFGMPHDVLGQYAAAIVRAAPGLEIAHLYEYARERLGPAKAPRRITVADELPRTPTGKVLKHELPALMRALTLHGGQDAVAASGNRSEEQITRIWAGVLQRPVAPSDDFLELGGTSLEAAEVTVRVRRELGRAAREEDIYRAGTLAEYVQVVQAARELEAAADAPIARLTRRKG